jgi:hypothetical protein
MSDAANGALARLANLVSRDDAAAQQVEVER